MNHGFIALISVIIISAILIIMAASLSLNGFYGRFNILDSEFKERSSSIAESCVDTALLELANDPAYSGNATSTIGSNSCYIGAISTSTPGKFIFETRGIYQNSYTNLKITANTSDLAVTSWQELPNF